MFLFFFFFALIFLFEVKEAKEGLSIKLIFSGFLLCWIPKQD